MSNPFGGPKAEKNANLVLASLLAGNGPDTWDPYGNSSRPGIGENLSSAEREKLEKADKAWDKVLEKLGIKSYSSSNDKAKVFRYVSGGGSYSGSGGNNGDGGIAMPHEIPGNMTTSMSTARLEKPWRNALKSWRRKLCISPDRSSWTI